MNIGIDLAIFERLTGAPLTSKGFPQTDKNGVPINRSVIGPVDYPGPDGDNMLPSYGVRIPVPKNGQDISRGLTSKDPQAVKLFSSGWHGETLRQVPVFDVNIEGRKFEDVWPCVCFYWSDMDFAGENYVYDDPFCAPAPESPEVPVRSPAFGGEVGIGKTPKTQYRRHPDPWSPQYTIRTFAKTKWETMWMVRQIQHLFRPKDALIVQQADGSTQAVDMLYDSFQNMDVGTFDVAMTETPKEQRYYSRAFTYTIEGYLDNTIPEGSDNGFGLGPGDGWTKQNVILQRCLELANIRDEVLETATLDVILPTP